MRHVDKCFHFLGKHQTTITPIGIRCSDDATELSRQEDPTVVIIVVIAVAASKECLVTKDEYLGS